MKTVAVYTAGACCGAAVMGSTAFLSSPPAEGSRPLWRSSQSRLRASPSRARATRGSVGSRSTGCGVAGVASFAPLHELPRGGRSTAAAGSHQMTLLSNLDLKPAYRLFDTVPPPMSMEGVHQTCEVDLDVEGKAPYDVDPFKMVGRDLSPFSDSIKDLLDAEHPVLSMAAKHFFEKRHGKRFRPTVVALMAMATCKEPVQEHRMTIEFSRQGQLGQITEMIHVASLIHDDVLDEAEVRRGGMAVHKLYSNKVAVLAGDYLLARASVLLARLNNVEVVEIMATALDSLVQGEILQIKTDPEKLLEISSYLRKSYYKTASLITNACKSCTLLGGHDFDSEVARLAEEYGYHMGLAFQIVDDILDIVGAADTLGKPALADMSLGLATAPILYAAESAPELRQVIKRRFKNEGDKEFALRTVLAGDAVERSRELARWHAQRAVDAIIRLPPSDARDALVNICHVVLTRNK